MGRNWYSKIVEEFHKERNTYAFYKTQGFKKLWYFVIALIKKEKNKEFFIKLRIKYKMPGNGYIMPEGEHKYYPEEWELRDDWDIRREIEAEISGFCRQSGLLPRDWMGVFEGYLFYNKLLLDPDPNSHNLLLVSDLKEKKDSLGRNVGEDEINTYPVTLHISPYSTKRDILDYISKMYKTEIEPIQKKYRNDQSTIGKHRKKKPTIQKRNKFLWNNRHLSRKQLSSTVNSMYPNKVDQGGVGKIISIEKKQRE